MIILSIETSCDETSAAVLKETDGKLDLLSNVVSSQIEIHKKYGGVVPEVAAREHVKNINPVIDEALDQAKVTPKEIDLIAVASGPGLVTSLVVGTEAAKSLAYAWDKPLLQVNHMYGHIAGNFYNNDITFPAIALIVSGGHTELIHLKSYTSFKKIGQTIDDASGEAFDKVAKLLDLGYPGGPKISMQADKYSQSRHPELVSGSNSIKFPRPMLNSGDYNFSFSGLKTAVLYTVQKMKQPVKGAQVEEVCYEFQEAVIDVLVKKALRAAKDKKAKTIMMAGGVAANKQLRETLKTEAEKNGYEFFVPEFSLCTDNAGMTAIGAYYLAKQAKKNNFKAKADPNWELE